MAVSVTNTTIAALNTDQTLTANVATVDSANTPEVFTITPTKKGSKLLIVFQNANSNGAYTYSIAAGAAWASTSAITGSIAQNAKEVLQLDTAKVMSSTGTILVTLTPATDKKLASEHVATMFVAELI